MLMSVAAISPPQIKAARALLGWSQRELAQRAGVALSTIADFERGAREPIQNNLQAMLKSLENEGISFSPDGAVRGKPAGRSPALPKGRTPFRFIGETDLRRWAGTRECQERMPELLTRLIRAEKGHEALLRFPGGDAIAMHGWDGRCQVATGTTHIPAGDSGWEITAQAEKIGQKADREFKKRTDAPGDMDPPASTFVFATPCRWPGKEAWIKNKKALGKWADVRAYDAVDLVHWIEMNPAVGHWLAVQIGKLPEGLRQIEKVWEEWSLSTQWPMKTDLVLAGRDEEATRVLNWLYGEPAHLALQAESPEEGLVFLHATIDRLPPDYRVPYLARCLVAIGPEQARALGQSAIPLIVGLENADPGLARWLVGQGHHVYSVFGSDVGAPENVIRLSRAPRTEAEAALQSMGLREDEAREAARDMAGSLAVFRRLHPSVSARLAPEWASQVHAAKMVPGLLAGAWDEAKAADRATLECLAHRDYDEISRDLTPWLTVPDSPLRKSGSVWKLASPRDALFRLAPYVSAQDLRAFTEVAVEVLGSPDPRFDMPSDQRWYAPVSGKMPEHSEFLRTGLGEALMAFAIFGDKAGVANSSQSVTAVVHKLLHGADARQWWSVSRQLDLLAESAPDTFLSAVEASLDLNDPAVMALFIEDQAPVFGGAYHSHLLWALESLAWSPKHLPRVARVLARLATLDPPGGRYANRPASSLRKIFLLWMPQTYASLRERLDVLDRVLGKHQPRVAWRLMCDLVPTAYDSMMPSSRPRWRDFSDGRAEEEVTSRVWMQSAEEVAKRLLEDVGTDGNRWLSLLDHVVDFFPDRRQELMKLLSERLEKFDPPTRSALWAAVRKLLNHHRRFAKSDWALSAADLAPLDSIYERLSPEEARERVSWLFVNGEVPLLHPAVDDWEADHAEAATLRRQVIEEIFQRDDADGVLSFAETVESPHSVGFAIAEANIGDAQKDALLVQCLRRRDRLTEVAQGMLRALLQRNDIVWGYKLLNRAASRGWTTEMVLVVVLMMPASRPLWDCIAVFGKDVESEYWKRVPSISVASVQDEGTFAIGKLLSAGRARAAVSVAARQRSAIPSGTLAEVLEKALVEPLSERQVDFDVSNFQYYLEHVLQELNKRGDIDDDHIARLEWAYCPVLRHSERSLSALHRRLATNPGFFAEVVGMIYRPAADSGVSEAESGPSEHRQAMLERAYQLLRSWHQVPGAQNGAIDDAQLERWIKEARRICAETGRAAVGDQHIGGVLAYAPAGADAVWPGDPVRDVIEVFRSAEIERGVLMGLIQKRGPTWRAMTDGGDQERELATQYRRFAESTRLDWPRTSAMLERIAQYYESEARQHDQDVERREWS